MPPRVYLITWGVLLLLTFSTFQMALIDLGRFNVVVALAIAVAKAALVVLFFMHMRYTKGLTWMVLFGSILWLVILIALTMDDEMTRAWMFSQS